MIGQEVFLTVLQISPDVEFCAYAIPHPSEAKMNIRIQTTGMHHFPPAQHLLLMSWKTTPQL
jgi:DNA-directed RNA polymerase subunit L